MVFNSFSIQTRSKPLLAVCELVPIFLNYLSQRKNISNVNCLLSVSDRKSGSLAMRKLEEVSLRHRETEGNSKIVA